MLHRSIGGNIVTNVGTKPLRNLMYIRVLITWTLIPSIYSISSSASHCYRVFTFGGSAADELPCDTLQVCAMPAAA